MSIDEKSIDRKTIDEKPIHSDNSINGKLIDKGRSIDLKKPELDSSRIFREKKNNDAESQVDKSRLIQEWRLDVEDKPRYREEIN